MKISIKNLAAVALFFFCIGFIAAFVILDSTHQPAAHKSQPPRPTAGKKTVLGVHAEQMFRMITASGISSNGIVHLGYNWHYVSPNAIAALRVDTNATIPAIMSALQPEYRPGLFGFLTAEEIVKRTDSYYDIQAVANLARSLPITNGYFVYDENLN